MGVIVKTKLEIIITQNMIDDYAEASKDYNPIHIDEEFAKKSIFKSRIAHGMLTLSIVMEFIYKNFNKEWYNNSTLETRFKNPVYPNEKLIIEYDLNKLPNNKIIVKCHKENGDEILTTILVL
ncbi:MAG: hypothetical protein CL775_01720 [Chloroflexi bacterium]|nr:hypothetical protein [Chloroflexota bacterium]|tara:strand:- start:838 stop:1206 length:369 start_codon:yes stop_codon:yes gene_type:complete